MLRIAWILCFILVGISFCLHLVLVFHQLSRRFILIPVIFFHYYNLSNVLIIFTCLPGVAYFWGRQNFDTWHWHTGLGLFFENARPIETKMWNHASKSSPETLRKFSIWIMRYFFLMAIIFSFLAYFDFITNWKKNIEVLGFMGAEAGLLSFIPTLIQEIDKSEAIFE